MARLPGRPRTSFDLIARNDQSRFRHRHSGLPGGYAADGRILAAADAIVSPTIPDLLSLRMLALLAGQAERSRSRSSLVAVFNMVDPRKTLHRRACELAVEQVESSCPSRFHTPAPLNKWPPGACRPRSPRRTRPPPGHSPRSGLNWSASARDGDDRAERQWASVLRGLETLIQLDATERPLSVPGIASAANDGAGIDVVHRFDSERRDLAHRGTPSNSASRQAASSLSLRARTKKDARKRASIDPGRSRFLRASSRPSRLSNGGSDRHPRTRSAHSCRSQRRHLRRVDTGQPETLASVRPALGTPGSDALALGLKPYAGAFAETRGQPDCFLLQMLLDSERGFPGRGFPFAVDAVGAEPPALHVVLEHRAEHVQHSGPLRSVFHREHELDAFIKIRVIQSALAR